MSDVSNIADMTENTKGSEMDASFNVSLSHYLSKFEFFLFCIVE